MPIYKKGNKNLPENYRPIALLSTVGKLFEKFIFKHLHNYVLDNSLLYSMQSGFFPNHSTIHQLIEIYHNICINRENHESTCLVFCDISKAFDRVWHKGCWLNLGHLEYRGTYLNC